MSDFSVDVEVLDRIGVVTMNRPHKRNALSRAFMDAIADAVRRLDVDDGVDVLVLTGTDPAFSAGVDLREAASQGAAGFEPLQTSPWGDLGKPLIAAVNGVAVTGGFELALNCDFVVASERARFADTHARVGVMPGWGMSVLLPRIIGWPRAMELSLTGNFIDADEAYRLRLVNHVVPHQDLMPTTLRIARDVAGADQRAVRALLASLRRTADADGRSAALTVERETSVAWLRGYTGADLDARRAAVIERGRNRQG